MGDIATAIMAVLPVKQIYEDAAQPSVRQLGKIGEDLLKCIRLAIFPLQYGAGLHDRYTHFVAASVAAVPEARRVPPPTQILGPVLEGLRYEPEGSDLEALAAALLSTAMDSNAVQYAHPSYPKIITQLAHDEVVLLKQLSQRARYRIYESDLVTIKNDFGIESTFFNNTRTIKNDLEYNLLFSPSDFNFYFNHIYHLGLAHVRRGHSQPIWDSGKQIGSRAKEHFELTAFGVSFATACKLITP